MFRAVALLIVIVLIVVGAWFGRPDPEFLTQRIVDKELKPLLADLAADAAQKPIRVVLDIQPANAELADLVRKSAAVEGIVWLPTTEPTMADEGETRRAGEGSIRQPQPPPLPLPPSPPQSHAQAKVDHTLRVTLDTSPHRVTLNYALDGRPRDARWISWLSVLPPLLAVISAILLRRVILCLGLGIVAGGIIAVWPAGHWPAYGAWYAFHEYFLGKAILSTFNVEIISFVLLISATVGIAQAAGGIRGVIDVVVRFCTSPRSARLGTSVAGMLVFFDDYLNCIIVGNAMRPLTDRYRVSRAKLAYIVDSTAAPVAGLAVVSTWIAYELSQIQLGLDAAGLTERPFDMFIRSLPYRFYCMLTLVLVFLIAWTGRDYGPMRKAERDAMRDGLPEEEDDAAHLGRPGKARYAVLPIGLTLAAIVAGLWWTGHYAEGEPPIQAAGTIDYLQQVLGRANSATAFSRAAMFGYVFTLGLVTATGVLSFKETMRASLLSVKKIMIAVVILLLAWSIGAACRDVGTADYLVALFRKVLNPIGFSLIVFGLGCLISFSTGTSYGTMAILLPNVVPLAFSVGEASPLGGIALVTMSVGAVLEGSIFGDHCSPISDTTILSAIASRCELIEHVRTQMPYALTAMAVAVAAGYIPVSIGVSPYASLVAGIVLLAIVVHAAGRRTDAPAADDRASSREKGLGTSN